MRYSALAATLVIVLSSTLAAAQERKLGAAIPPASAETKVSATEAVANAAQQRSDAQQKAWDRKMKALTGTVCTGC
jgi:hypothetical protein